MTEKDKNLPVLSEIIIDNQALSLEKLIERPRHIEIQIFGFGDGQAVHNFERECSIQRRFQKIIEESPAPDLLTETRDSMARAALALAKAECYQGAGTIEFIVAPDGNFYFLEMNTRIQVEHPVTEFVTGVDLLKYQILVHSDLALPEYLNNINPKSIPKKN